MQRAKTAYFVHRQEGQQPQALLHVRIINVAPVLVEIERGSFVRVKPQRALFSLAHLPAVVGQQQLERAGECLFAVLAAHQVRAAEHVAPLVIAAHFQPAAVAVEQLQEVVGLHEHVGEFEERQTVVGRHARLVAVSGQHLVDGEHRADVAHELDEVQVAQPVRVVDDNRLVVGEIKETAHLLLDALDVVVNRLDGHHLAHVGLAGRVADHCRAAAHQRNRAMSRALHVRHRHNRDVMPDVEGIGGRIEADVEGGRLFELLVQFVFKGGLGNEAAFFQNVKNVHGEPPIY